MMSSEPYASRYLAIETQTANPLQLVVMLYDGAVQYLQEARGHIRRGEIEGRTRAINRTLAIISELQASLNFEDGGQIARSLESLYAYMKGRLISANLGEEDEPLAEVISLLSTVKSAWQDLASLALRQSPESAVPKQAQIGIPANGTSDSCQSGTVNLTC